MFQVQDISTAATQKKSIVLDDGTIVEMVLNFKPLQLGWFLSRLTYGGFTIYGLRISVSPNMLHQFRNQVPFGIACFCQDNREPTLQEDFFSGAAKLYIMKESEVQYYTDYLNGEI